MKKSINMIMAYVHVIIGGPGSGQEHISKDLVEYLHELCPGQTSKGTNRVKEIKWGALKNWDPNIAEAMHIGIILRKVSAIKFNNPEVEHIVISGAYGICHWNKLNLLGPNSSLYFVRRTSEIDAIEFTENFYNKALTDTLGPDQKDGFISWAREMHEDLDRAVSKYEGMWIPYSEFVTGPHGSVIVVPPTLNEAASKQILVYKQ